MVRVHAQHTDDQHTDQSSWAGLTAEQSDSAGLMVKMDDGGRGVSLRGPTCEARILNHSNKPLF